MRGESDYGTAADVLANIPSMIDDDLLTDICCEAIVDAKRRADYEPFRDDQDAFMRAALEAVAERCIARLKAEQNPEYAYVPARLMVRQYARDAGLITAIENASHELGMCEAHQRGPAARAGMSDDEGLRKSVDGVTKRLAALHAALNEILAIVGMPERQQIKPGLTAFSAPLSGEVA